MFSTQILALLAFSSLVADAAVIEIGKKKTSLKHRGEDKASNEPDIAVAPSKIFTLPLSYTAISNGESFSSNIFNVTFDTKVSYQGMTWGYVVLSDWDWITEIVHPYDSTQVWPFTTVSTADPACQQNVKSGKYYATYEPVSCTQTEGKGECEGTDRETSFSNAQKAVQNPYTGKEEDATKGFPTRCIQVFWPVGDSNDQSDNGGTDDSSSSTTGRSGGNSTIYTSEDTTSSTIDYASAIVTDTT